MTKNSPFDWLISKIAKDDYIKELDLISYDFLRITRKDRPTINITHSNLKKFTIGDIKSILKEQEADFILNTYKDAKISGDVYDYLVSINKNIGDFGDIMRVLRDFDYVEEYIPPKEKFVLRGLRQHNAVQNVLKLERDIYEVRKNNLNTVIILVLYDYDIGNDSLRTALDKYEHFDIILKGNPNGGITNSAYKIALEKKISIFTFKELLRELNF